MARKCGPRQPVPAIKPIDIKLPERVPLEGGTLFVYLPTLAELEQFWVANRDELPYSAEGIAQRHGNDYMTECEWVFGPTKAAVAKTVMRWNALGITCQWYDWATEDPDSHAAFLLERPCTREEEIRNGQWTEADETHYQQIRPETYRGWWILANLPLEGSGHDWLAPGKEINDPHLPLDQVAIQLQEQIFDSGSMQMNIELDFRDRTDMDNYIAGLKDSETKGEPRYGADLVEIEDSTERVVDWVAVWGKEFFESR